MINDRQGVEAVSKDTFKTPLLLIDEEQAIRRYLRLVLGAENFEVYEATSVKEGLVQTTLCDPEIVLLDLHLSDIENADFIRAIHRIKRVPIIILSSLEDVDLKILALNAGAEDYIVKPFNTGELLARIRVALRRTRTVNTSEVFQSDNLEIDFIRRIVKVDKQPIDLTRTEYKLLRVLVIHADQPVTHLQLWQAVRRDDEAFEAHTIRVHLSNLRKKLETDPTDPRHILTEIGVGYRFQSEAMPVRI